MSKVEVKFVRQSTSRSCVHACISMVTGLEIDALIRRFGNRGLSSEEEATVLTEMGILPVPVPMSGGAHNMPYLGVYFLTVPSLNLPGASHRVVCRLEQDRATWTVFDPNAGRKGKKYYPRRAMYSDRRPFSYSEVTLLDPLRLHHGTRDRLKLYRQRPSVQSPKESD